MLEKILPAEVACAEAFGDSPEGVLFPEEEALLARAVDKRRLEFTTRPGTARAAPWPTSACHPWPSCSASAATAVAARPRRAASRTAPGTGPPPSRAHA